MSDERLLPHRGHDPVLHYTDSNLEIDTESSVLSATLQSITGRSPRAQGPAARNRFTEGVCWGAWVLEERPLYLPLRKM